MRKTVLMFFLALSLAFTSVMAWECCANEQASHQQHASKDADGHKALDAHHCAAQHAMDERITPPAIAHVYSVSQKMALIVPSADLFRSLSRLPLLEPPLRA